MPETDYVKMLAKLVGTLDDRVAEHMKEASKQAVCTQKQLTEIKTSMVTSAQLVAMRDDVTVNKTKLKGVLWGLGVGLTGLFGWVISLAGKLS